MALAAYRHVLRSIATVFKHDAPLLVRAREQARHTFGEHRALDGEAAAAQIAHAEQVAELLRRNVVQGEQVGGEPGGPEAKYRLRITRHTELGDNEPVKEGMGRRDMGSLAGVEACRIPDGKAEAGVKKAR